MNPKIFVFGTNLQGIHGAGAARYARFTHNYPLHLGSGPGGTAYGIPTKATPYIPLDLKVIQLYIEQFLAYAHVTPHLFQITRIGCGLAGFNDDQIAPLFKGASSNCQFDTDWQVYLPNSAVFWGTHE